LAAPLRRGSLFPRRHLRPMSPPGLTEQRWKATSILRSLNVKTARSWRGIVPFTHLAREGRMTVTIGRRELLAALGGAAAWPLAARAQQAGRTRRIGFLTSSSPVVSIESSYHAGLLRGMRELGYVVGKDFIVEWRFAEGKLERFAEFAAELVRSNIDVFVLGTPTAVPPVRQATSSIPIVMGFSTDPVGNGFIASLARPGGNITGLASSQDDAVPKQMELLTMLVPDLSRIGLLVDPSSPNSSPIVKNEGP